VKTREGPQHPDREDVLQTETETRILSGGSLDLR
jgi:hypothetical protein